MLGSVGLTKMPNGKMGGIASRRMGHLLRCHRRNPGNVPKFRDIPITVAGNFYKPQCLHQFPIARGSPPASSLPVGNVPNRKV